MARLNQNGPSNAYANWLIYSGRGCNGLFLFFPSTSFAYQMEIHKSENPADETVVSSATNKARKEWSSTEFSHGGGPKESESPENQLCFYEEPMGDPEFVRLAQLILDPIFKHAREEKTL